MAQDRPVLGIFLMLGFCIVAPMGDAVAKLLGQTMPLGELLFVRFAVPVAVIANEALYDVFLESRFVESTQVIESAGSDIEKASAGQDSKAASPAGDGDSGLLESLGRTFDNTRQFLDFNQKVAFIKARAAELIEHLIQLSVVFILQTGVLPIAFLWVFLQLFRQLLQNKN